MTLLDITALTENNNHVSAYIAGCDYIGEDANTIRDTFVRIQTEHNRLGYLDSKLSSQVYNNYQSLMSLAKEKLPHAEFKSFYQSF